MQDNPRRRRLACRTPKTNKPPPHYAESKVFILRIVSGRDHLLNRYTHALANDTRYHDFPIVALPPFLRLGLGVSQGRSGGHFNA
jgi:hypothetical protein